MAVEAQLCPQCGGTIHFSALQTELVCPYCGTTVVKPAAPLTAPPLAGPAPSYEADARRNQLIAEMVVLQRRLNVEGVAAPAKIVSLQPLHLTVGTGAGASGQLFSVVVEVQPAGGPAYTAQAKIAVLQASLDKYQPGTLVNVKVDPRDPQVLVFEGRR
jgi:hypothetical protein